MSSSADSTPAGSTPVDPALVDLTSADSDSAELETGGGADPVPADPVMAKPAPEDPAPADPTGPPGWDSFAERPVPEGLGQAVNLSHELAGVLQRARDDLAKDRGRAAQEGAAVLGTLYELAALAGQLELQLARAEAPLVEGGNKRLHDLLRVLKNQMLEELRQRGIEVRDPMGCGHDEVAEWADVVHWRSGPQFAAEVVAQTIEPAVFHHGRDDHDGTGDDDKVVRRARVVMGCPEPETP